MNVLLVRSPGTAGFIDQTAARLRSLGASVALADQAGFPGAIASDDWEVIGGPGSLPFDAPLLRRLRRLNCVAAVGSGTDGIDLGAATEAGVLVAHGGVPENAQHMAEATIALMLALLYDLGGAEAQLRGGGARRQARSLAGRTVGLIGLGAIAREVAVRLRPWNARVIGWSRSLPPGETLGGVQAVALDELLRTADIVSLHLALTPETSGLLNADRLGRMKPGALLINTARGGLVDEAALAARLREGRVAGAALDVFAIEPLPADSPLHTAPNLILTPHSVGHTSDGSEAVAEAWFDNIAAALDRRPPRLLRNPEAVPRWRAASFSEATDDKPRGSEG